MKTNTEQHAWLLLALAALLQTNPYIRAGTLTVTSTADSGPGTLRDALANAVDGDTIDATGASGVVLLTSGKLVVNKSVSIVGPGPGTLSLDGNAAGHVIYVSSNTVVNISGLTITNGMITGTTRQAASGGGIYNDHATLMVSNCDIIGNSPLAGPPVGYFFRTGGGIYNDGILTLADSTLFNNSADYGGGISSGGRYGEGKLTVARCVFDDNQAMFGGGIENSAELTVAGSTFTSNSVSGVSDGIGNNGGGAIHNDGVHGNAVMTISDSMLTGNSAIPHVYDIGDYSQSDGGAIYNDGLEGNATLNVSNCVLSGNSASWGGSVFNDASWGGNATATMTGGFLSQNSAVVVGGAIENSGYQNGNARLMIFDSILGSNSAPESGAIDNDGYSGNATVIVSNSIVTGNTAIEGGAIFTFASSPGNTTVTVIGTTVSDNAGVYGGALFSVAEGTPLLGPCSATLTIVGSTFGGNSAFQGGGIDNESGSANVTVLVANSTLSGNAAGDSGGGIYNLGDAALTLINDTFSGNSATNSGAAIYNASTNYDGSAGAELEIGSTILNGGSAGGSTIVGAGTPVTSLGFNLSSDDAGGFLTNPTDMVNTDPMLGPLKDNGGPTFTHALLPGSPAIDKGLNFSGSTDDQRGPGFGRTFDNPAVPNAPGGDGTDIGAFEVQPDIDQLVPCEGPRTGGTWKNHGEYVRAMIETATDLLKADFITREQWDQIVTTAAQSRCGWNQRNDYEGDLDWNRQWNLDRDGDWGRDRN